MATPSTGRERRRNPFTASKAGGRALSALQLPLFLLRPPAGYGVLTTKGRRTGRTRPRCVRAVRAGDVAILVAIKPRGGSSGWLANALANPEVELRLPGGTFAGRARPVADPAEGERLTRAYCESIVPFDYLTWMNWRSGRPTRARIAGLLRGWFETGTPLVVELHRGRTG